MKSRKPILYMKQCSVLQSKCYLALAQRHGYDHKCLSILVATKSTQHSAQHTRIYWMHIRTMAAENASRSSSTMRNRYFWPLHFWPPPPHLSSYCAFFCFPLTFYVIHVVSCCRLPSSRERFRYWWLPK